jgi:hypothetical protein
MICITYPWWIILSEHQIFLCGDWVSQEALGDSPPIVGTQQRRSFLSASELQIKSLISCLFEFIS